ncbi:hypothetical protein [Runella zeae]|uniref:hypothetical protein n=1 Tax=Runella zeae TaxID=94255 RepID=UPI0012FCDBC8|nr:hypothetical protein [Runella zeae]
MADLQNFGHTLCKIRLEKSLSLDTIADDLGISREAYRKTEKPIHYRPNRTRTGL